MLYNERQKLGQKTYKNGQPQGRKGINMKTYHKDFLATASIADKADGTARLIIRDGAGRKQHDKVHASRKAAYAAWRRYCN